MVPPFTFPQSLGSLEDEDYDSNSLSVQNPTSLTTLTPSQLEEFAKGVSFDLSDKEIFCVEEQDVFDRVYSLVKEFSCLTPMCKLNVTESLRSNFSVLIPTVDSLLRRVSQNQDEDKDDESDGGDELSLADRVASCRNAFKIYTFFLVHIVLIEESNSSSTNSAKVVVSSRKKHLVSSWKWESQRARILTSVARSLEIDLSSLFGTSDLDENYLSFMVINAFSMFENAAILKDSETKDALTHIIGACATKYHYAAQSCAQILHLVHKYDFAVSHLADVVGWAEKKYADGSMASSLIREIGRTSPKDYVKDTVGADNVGRFLVELADKMPKLVSINVGLLIVHFAGESYKMRNALVGVLGKLVMKAFDDTEGEGSSKSTRLRTKQAMLEILLERCRDVSAYTRSRVLQVWAELCEEKSVSMGMWNEVSEIAAGRLEDKSAIVRKSALNLLITMLQHNPFGPHLRAASFEATLEQYKKKLDDLGPTAPSAESSDETSNGDGEVHNESLSDSCLPREEETQMDDSVPDVGNLEQTRVLVASLGAGLRFSNCVSATMPTLVQLMASSSASDVENTILLLMRCRQFQIDGSEACLRKMLPLVFSQDKAIYEAVENAFIAIYVGKSPVETAKNLSSLAVDSNIGDLASLEFLIGALMSKGDLTSSTLSALWDFFCFNISGTTAEQSRGALSILCMAAKTSNTILSSHLQDIVDIGFGRWAKVEPLLVRTACLALQRLSEEDKKKLLSTYGGRVFSILESLVTGFWLPEHIWYAAADRAISTVYAIHTHPEKMAADLVKKSLNSVFGGEELQSGSFDTLTAVEVTKLSRFLFVTSHIAMNQLVYIESRVRKIQKDKAKREKIAIEENHDNSTLNAHKDNINAELGIAASEDAFLDTLSERAEKEIVSGGSSERNLIGYCTPFLSKLCRNYNLMQKYPELQASGMLALCRFMIIDADFCGANLQLLFTVVENAPSETVRSNCTVALGDLAVRFPNLLEPWTEHMYARLRDPSISVRKNTVLVLSHLILNDMMKVKGYINEMAICLEDEDERISNLAKLFFHELSKKGSNPIYNLLPDILGKLCNQNLKEESFCNIMQFLIGSIKKDKQMESLVEKLCHRFSGVTDVKLYEYISYCLSQLSYTDKSMKKLIELFKTYEHALSEDSVMDNFRTIINKGKKFAKPELKSCIEEFEEKLSKFHVERKEQELTAKNAQSHQQKVESLESIVVTGKDKDEVTGKDKDEVTEKDKDEVTEKDKEEVDGSVITEDSEVVDPSVEAQTECSPLEPGCAEPEDKSHASSEVTDSRMDENEVQSPRTRPKGSTRSRAKRSSKSDQNVDTSNAPRRTTRSSRRP